MIYLDYNATTPVLPEVLAAMMPYFSAEFANASNTTHVMGWKAADAVKKARDTISKLLVTDEPEGIVFTSGATEANNLILKSCLINTAKPRQHIITQKTEHESILKPLEHLESNGVNVSYLSVDAQGRVDAQELQSCLRKDTVLVSIMHANNETGIIQNIDELLKVTRKYSSALFHIDAAQTAGKIPLNLSTLAADFVSLSAHKFYGPKGVGALICRTKTSLEFLKPLLHGGGQEAGLRSGTLNVPGIVGMATALDIVNQSMTEEAKRLKILRDNLKNYFKAELEETYFNGDDDEILPHVLNVSFRFVDSGSLLLKLPKLALSSGSACSTGKIKPSNVILAMTHDEERAKSSIRFSLGKHTTAEDIQTAKFMVTDAVKQIRSKSLEYEMFKSR